MRKLIAAGLFGATLAPAGPAAGHASAEPQGAETPLQQDGQASADTPDENSAAS